MKVVSVSGGKFTAVISKQDYRSVSKYKWNINFSKGKNRKVGQPYARAYINGKMVYLHRFIMNPPMDMHVDHLNHCTLDCRRENLEVVSPIENNNRRRCCKKDICL